MALEKIILNKTVKISNNFLGLFFLLLFFIGNTHLYSQTPPPAEASPRPMNTCDNAPDRELCEKAQEHLEMKQDEINRVVESEDSVDQEKFMMRYLNGNTEDNIEAVSYTHLTLPTICSV